MDHKREDRRQELWSAVFREKLFTDLAISEERAFEHSPILADRALAAFDARFPPSRQAEADRALAAPVPADERTDGPEPGPCRSVCHIGDLGGALRGCDKPRGHVARHTFERWHWESEEGHWYALPPDEPDYPVKV